MAGSHTARRGDNVPGRWASALPRAASGAHRRGLLRRRVQGVGPVPDSQVPRLLGRGMTMSDQLARHARTRGGEVAFVFGSVRLTYREIDERASRLANVLR